MFVETGFALLPPEEVEAAIEEAKGATDGASSVSPASVSPPPCPSCPPPPACVCETDQGAHEHRDVPGWAAVVLLVLILMRQDR